MPTYCVPLGDWKLQINRDTSPTGKLILDRLEKLHAFLESHDKYPLSMGGKAILKSIRLEPNSKDRSAYQILISADCRAKLTLAEAPKQIRVLQENLKTASILEDQLKEANNKITALEEDSKTQLI
ncbi:hypothetical protein JTE90_006761 [Oedothorax gibbosus]|uniref:Uncharacterized protein n=1 Tax=Oedothorax gibbosus TaxID=931172 RepID=A0AAV6UKY9_9ARAC|nr:hypothetical protein JTE90_006761 [Oedothorax gibbosus]